MKAPNSSLSLSSLLIGSLLLCGGSKAAWSKQEAEGVSQVKKMVQICLTTSAQQAVVACELIATVLSQGPDSPVEVRIRINDRLRNVLVELGRYAEAEAPARKAAAAAQESKQRGAIVLQQNGVATVLKHLGRYNEAEELFRNATELAKKEYGPQGLPVAVAMGNLAGVLLDRGKLEEAESLFRKCLAILEKKLDPDDPALAMTQGNLAAVLYAQGKREEAESLYRKCLAIQQKKLDAEHPSLATTQGNLALVLLAQGKLEEAESLFRKCLAIQQKKLDAEHPSLATTHTNLSWLYMAQGKVKEAVTERQKTIQSVDQQLRSSPTEDMAEALLASHVAEEAFVYGLPLLPGAAKEAERLAMSTALLFKGRTMEAGRMVRRELQQGIKTEEQSKKYQRMVELLGQRDQELVRLAHGSGERGKTQELLWQAQQLERELSKEVGVKSSADVPTLDDVTQKVAKALSEDAVLVEVGLGWTPDFSRSSSVEFSKTVWFHYVAMLLFPNGEVRVVKLGGKDEVEEATQTFLAALNNPSDKIEQVANAAYKKLFAPLEKELGGVRQVILSPDGALSAIPFGALRDDKGYLVDRLSFRYISSGRELLNRPSQKPTTQPAVLVATRVPNQDQLLVAEKVGRDLAQMQKAKLTLGATEGQVLAQQSPIVLTLISHGYNGDVSKQGGMSARLPTQLPTQSKYPRLMANARDSTPLAKLVMAEKEKTEELMNSSGLLMMPGPQGQTSRKQDGRLTAVEVREMNLQGTKLVMLLTCKGAAGGLSFGQGVYGLRRSVLQAGAETVVGALWSVEESSASELAKKYMTKLWTDKKATRVGAMEAAMKEMREDPRYRHPYYWAPFVVMGMDGPLSN